jgi:hypothetical protein
MGSRVERANPSIDMEIYIRIYVGRGPPLPVTSGRLDFTIRETGL